MIKVGIVSYYPDGLEKYKATIEQLDYLIAVDSGATALADIGIVPDLCIGDFDSVDQALLAQMPNVICLPTDKDETDTHVALQYVHDNIEAADVLLFVAMSGRSDQQFGLLALYYRFIHMQMDVQLMTDQGKITMLLPGHYQFKCAQEQYISFFAYVDNVRELSIVGTGYELEKANLKVGSDLGCSNTFAEAEITLTFIEGTLLIFFME